MFLNDEIIGTCIGQFHWRSLGWFEEISWATAKFQVYFEICTDLAWCKTNIPNLWKQRSFILRCSSIFMTMTLDVNLIVDMFVWCTRRLTIHWTKRIIGFRGWVELGTKSSFVSFGFKWRMIWTYYNKFRNEIKFRRTISNSS